jgi:hypothetical protein
MATIEKDIFGRDFSVGTVVYVRCIVTAINQTSPFGGSGDLVTCQVEVNGNAGEVSPGPIFQVSPVQCRFTGSTYQH